MRSKPGKQETRRPRPGEQEGRSHDERENPREAACKGPASVSDADSEGRRGRKGGGLDEITAEFCKVDKKGGPTADLEAPERPGGWHRGSHTWCPCQ